MILTNTTDYPDYFLRRLVSWCCKELGLPVRYICQASFCKRHDGDSSGHAWFRPKRIHVSVGSLDGLVHITAHEVAHLWLYYSEKSWKPQEKKTTWHEEQLFAGFQLDREQLLEKWNRPPKRRPPARRKTVQEQRAEAVQNKLAEWIRKQKLAATKVRKYKAKVRYYERAMAAKTAKGGRHETD